jgi:hypothetical protein
MILGTWSEVFALSVAHGFDAPPFHTCLSVGLRDPIDSLFAGLI